MQRTFFLLQVGVQQEEAFLSVVAVVVAPCCTFSGIKKEPFHGSKMLFYFLLDKK